MLAWQTSCEITKVLSRTFHVDQTSNLVEAEISSFFGVAIGGTSLPRRKRGKIPKKYFRWITKCFPLETSHMQLLLLRWVRMWSQNHKGFSHWWRSDKKLTPASKNCDQSGLIIWHSPLGVMLTLTPAQQNFETCVKNSDAAEPRWKPLQADPHLVTTWS